MKIYFLKYAKYSILLLFTSYITEIIANLINSKILFMDFTFKCIVCILVPNILFLVVFSNSEYFRYIVNILKSVIQKIVNIIIIFVQKIQQIIKLILY